jgi:WD40-like Beta Propeller Repeat
MYLRKLFSLLVICYPALVQSQTSTASAVSTSSPSDVVVVSKSPAESPKKNNPTPTTVHIKPLGVVEVKNMKILNGSKDDFSPMYFEDGLLFCSNSRKVKKGTDPDKVPDDMNLKYALFDSTGQLIKPTSFGKRTNSKTHEGPVCFTHNGDTMFLTRNMSKGGIDKKSKNGLFTLKIYLKTRDSLGNFLGDKLLPFELENYSYCHPSITRDGKRLFFSSNIPGGFGGMDLYMIRKINDSTWTAPINLGARVNTAQNEVFPHFSEKGILYFASNGQPKGKGGLDIFGIELDKRNGAITSLGEPFNTVEDDFGLIFLPNNPKKGFFSSNRIGGLGGDDIYEFEEKEE